jgi:hypothetical protein
MTCVLSLEALYDLCLVLGGSLWLVSCPWRIATTCVLSLVARHTLALHSRGTRYALLRYSKALVCCLWVMYYMVLQ